VAANLPLHMPPVHPSELKSLPLHSAPPLDGLGLSHSRLRRWRQSGPHGDHSVHADHPPDRAAKKKERKASQLVKWLNLIAINASFISPRQTNKHGNGITPFFFSLYSANRKTVSLHHYVRRATCLPWVCWCAHTNRRVKTAAGRVRGKKSGMGKGRKNHG
jgi:hypothetical protein